MFTLGDKKRILNADADVSVVSSAGVVRATSAAITLADTIRINGFGDFPIADITDIKLHRYVAPAGESKDYTVTVPTGLAIGDAIEVRIYAKTSRYQSELKNNFIGAARPITFMTAPLTAIADTDIVTAIVAAWVDRGFLFHNEVPVITVGAGADPADIEVAVAAGYESVNITKVEIKRANSGIGTQTPVSLAVNVVNTVGTEGLGTGKFLEESVKMATSLNNDPYGVDNDGTMVDLRAGYTEVTFAISAPYTENLSISAADHGPLPATHRFTVWLNEATCMAANGAANDLAAVAVLAAGALTDVTVTAIAAPLTAAQERTEALIIATGASVATASNFIA